MISYIEFDAILICAVLFANANDMIRGETNG